MLPISAKPEYTALVKSIAAANNVGTEPATALLEDVLADIEQGDICYFDAASELGLSANLGKCGFDAADYLSTLI